VNSLDSRVLLSWFSIVAYPLNKVIGTLSRKVGQQAGQVQVQLRGLVWESTLIARCVPSESSL